MISATGGQAVNYAVYLNDCRKYLYKGHNLKDTKFSSARPRETELAL